MVESVATEMLREAEEKLVMESTTNCLWEKDKKNQHKQLLTRVYYCS